MILDAWQVRPYKGIIFIEPMYDRINKLIGLENKKILHLFSGKSKIGETCDIIPFNNPKHNIDCSKELPFDKESFDTVLADPPYVEGRFSNVGYNLKPYSWYDEACRVLKKNGNLIVLHYINYITPKGFTKTHMIGIDIGPNFNARWLNIFKKQPNLL